MFIRSPHSSAQHPPIVSHFNQRKSQNPSMADKVPLGHTHHILIFQPSPLLFYAFTLICTYWLSSSSKKPREHPFQATPLLCSLSPETVACLTSSLFFFGCLLPCHFLNEAFPHILFKTALPLFLFVNFFLHRIHHPWTNYQYICT